MNIKGFRRILFGEKMPDKDNPKYKECYERDVDAGRCFTKVTHIDKAVAKAQGFANARWALLLVIVFGFVICGLTWNICHLTMVYRHHSVRRTATGMQDFMFWERHRILSTPRVRGFDTKESGMERPEQNGRLMNMPFEGTIDKYVQLD